MKLAQTKSIRAFTRTELIVTIACLALLAAIILPAVITPTYRAPKLSCRINQKNIGVAFRIWASDHNDRFPMRVSLTNGGTMELLANGDVFSQFRVLSNELTIPKFLYCPADKKKTEAKSFASGMSDNNVSYFLNLDAVEKNPTSLLAGDRNLTNSAPVGRRLIPITKDATVGWTKEIHFEQGNLLFGDGHVGSFTFTNGDARAIIKIPDGITNRLAIP